MDVKCHNNIIENCLFETDHNRYYVIKTVNKLLYLY